MGNYATLRLTAKKLKLLRFSIPWFNHQPKGRLQQRNQKMIEIWKGRHEGAINILKCKESRIK